MAKLAQAENDSWAWGISLLDWLNPEFTKAYAFPYSCWEEYCEDFPEDADEIPYTFNIADEKLKDVGRYYSPFCDERTYEIQRDESGRKKADSVGTVTEEWWLLLKGLLVRPDIDSEFLHPCSRELLQTMSRAFAGSDPYGYRKKGVDFPKRIQAGFEQAGVGKAEPGAAETYGVPSALETEETEVQVAKPQRAIPKPREASVRPHTTESRCKST